MKIESVDSSYELICLWTFHSIPCWNLCQQLEIYFYSYRNCYLNNNNFVRNRCCLLSIQYPFSVSTNQNHHKPASLHLTFGGVFFVGPSLSSIPMSIDDLSLKTIGGGDADISSLATRKKYTKVVVQNVIFNRIYYNKKEKKEKKELY